MSEQTPIDSIAQEPTPMMSGPGSAGLGSKAAPQGSGALRQFLGLFVVPLLVVAMCVAVFVLFGWAAYDRNSVGDYLDDLRDTRSVFAHRRKQAAYELSKILSVDPQALQSERGAAAELRRLFRVSEDLWVRRYLALVLGHIGDRESVPLLLEGVEDRDSQIRIYSLWALGALADPSAIPVLETALADPDPGIRKTAAFALRGFSDYPVVDALSVAVEDPIADVRWNASLALAQLGSARGVPVLEQMLDRRLLSQVPDITESQKISAMIGALRALAQLAEHADSDLISRLAGEDPSLKVRQAAIVALRVLEGAS